MTLAQRRTVTVGRRRSGVWAWVAVQIGFVALVAALARIELARAAESAENSHGSLWSILVFVTLPLAPMFAGLALVLTALVFLLGYVRGRRALTLALVGCSVLMVLVVAASLSPRGQALMGWVLG